jgi:hypothetical protein
VAVLAAVALAPGVLAGLVGLVRLAAAALLSLAGAALRRVLMSWLAPEPPLLLALGLLRRRLGLRVLLLLFLWLRPVLALLVLGHARSSCLASPH